MVSSAKTYSLGSPNSQYPSGVYIPISIPAIRNDKKIPPVIYKTDPNRGAEINPIPHATYKYPNILEVSPG